MGRTEHVLRLVAAKAIRGSSFVVLSQNPGMQ
jgi:hypothetical protein